MTMTVDVRVIDCGKRSEVKTSRNELTSCSVHSICTVSIFSKVGRDLTFKIYED